MKRAGEIFEMYVHMGGKLSDIYANGTACADNNSHEYLKARSINKLSAELPITDTRITSDSGNSTFKPSFTGGVSGYRHRLLC